MMKKALSIVLLLVLLLPVAQALAEVRSSVRFDQQSMTLTISASGLVAGNDYFLLITNPRAKAEDALAQREYMCVVTASDAGEVSHGIVCRTLTGDMQILMGGVFEDGVSPRFLGRVAARESVLPAALTAISAEAFMGANFTSMHIGSGVTSIGDRAFKDCVNLRTLYIENDNVAFGADVFAGCTDLVIVCGENSTAAAYARNCSNVTCRFE